MTLPYRLKTWSGPIVLAAVIGCAGGSKPPPAESPSGDGLTEQEAYERARPVFEKYCAGCHTSGSDDEAAQRHFRMDRYPFEGPHAENIGAEIREVLGAAGEPATMPQDRPGAVEGEDLELVLAWADAFDRAHAGTRARKADEHEHEHHEHEH